MKKAAEEADFVRVEEIVEEADVVHAEEIVEVTLMASRSSPSTVHPSFNQLFKRST